MFSYNAKIIHPITTSCFILGTWIFGYSVSFFIPKNHHGNHSEIAGNAPFVAVKSFFIFQSSLVTFLVVGIFGGLFLLIHLINIDKEKINKLRYLNPYIVLLFWAIRTYASSPKSFHFILPLAVIIGGGLHYFRIQEIWTEKINILMGFTLIADWVWSEIIFMQKKLKCKRLWSYQYVGCFVTLFIYHILPKRENF